ncbi:MAG: family transcriptional regulator, cyclic receptor protein [Candidatus Eremiobacteraeota bacterium]|nr:family transcriptional regulator, cyclic receptor protein [Candidatus Eremiobacteraeota bacterium]
MHDVRRTGLCPDNVLEGVVDGRSARTYPPRRVVFAQGDPADAVFYLQRGRIKMSLISPRGKEAVLAILGGDEFFGEGCLAGQTTRMMTATCITPCSVIRIEKAAMVALLHDRVAVAQSFIAHLLSRNARIEEDLTDQLFNSCEKRLARILLQLGRFGMGAPAEPAIVQLSQQTLADMIGTTRSRVSFFMSKFRRLGLIEYRGGLRVHSTLMNVILHE